MMKKLAMALCVVIFTANVQAALNAYLVVEGSSQGTIKGSATQPGREDQIPVIAFKHTVVMPRDAASGLPKGKRQHKPLTITKEIDRSTPLLMKSFVNNEKLTRVELRFWQPSPSGQESQFYTITLTNAHIVKIHQEMLNNKNPKNMQLREREHISFTYQSIEWTFEDGGITAQDDWVVPSR